MPDEDHKHIWVCECGEAWKQVGLWPIEHELKGDQ